MRLAEIATLVDGEICGDTEEEIIGVASIEEARPGDIVFAESEKYLEAAARSKASAILAPRNASATTKKALVLTENPRLAFVQVLESFQTPLRRPEGIHPTAILGQGVRIGEDVRIGANVVVGDRVVLGDRVTLFPGVSIGDDCALGEDSVLHPNVVLYSRVILGKRCLLHSGCVLGADGFGYVPVGATLRKVPQLGTVEVGDEVEIGANSCIDRAKTGATVIGSFTKIDNLVHVGHNVRVGHHSILIAQVGIAGGTQIGNGVILAGQSGVVDHVTIGDGARVGAQGGVVGDVPAGQTYSGYPARPHAEKMREYAALALLPDYLKRIRALEKRLAALEET